MKKIYIIILLIASFGIQSKVQGQTSKGNRFYTDKSIVYVDIELPITNYFVNDNEYLVLTPIIESEDQSLELLKVILYGKGRTTSDIQKGEGKPYAILNMENREDFVYKVDVTYSPWMENSKLRLKRAIYDAEGKQSFEIVNTISNTLIQRTGDPVYSQSPQNNMPSFKPTSLTDFNPLDNTYVMYFRYKKSCNITDILNNGALEGLCSAIDSLLLNKENNTRIKVDIIAGTCPFGIYNENEELTKKQALLLKTYLEGRYNQYNLDLHTRWISEDWTGLVQLIQQDENMPYKYEVIDIIDNTGIFTGREKDLMDLIQGEPYRYMKDNLFPKLWRIRCKISR